MEISRWKYEDLGEGKVSETFSAWPASTSTVSVNLKMIVKIIVKIFVKILLEMIVYIVMKIILNINVKTCYC